MSKYNLTSLEDLSFLGKEKLEYLTRITFTDKIMARTVLKIIPDFVYPNHLTIFRLLSIFVILYFLLTEQHLYVTILFTISAFSDALDGAIARTKGRITAWGIVYDPMADKLLIGTVAVFVVSKYLSVRLAVVVVAIEILLITLAYFRFSGQLVPAKLAGKIKMILQCFGIGFILLYMTISLPILLDIAQYVLYGAVFFGILSLFVYKSI